MNKPDLVDQAIQVFTKRLLADETEISRYAKRAAMQEVFQFFQANRVQGEPFGYIHHFAAHDERVALIDTTWEADGCADPLPHPTFPAMWKWSHCTPFYTTPQTAQATQAEVTDAAIDAATRHLYHNGKPTSKEYRVSIARAILALRPDRVPMTGEQWTDVLGSAGLDLLDLAKQWSDNKVHVYQVVNEAEKIVKAAVLRGITAQAKKEGA